MPTYTERMKAAREGKGLSHETAAARASRLLLPSQEFTSSTSRRTEQGDEDKADPIRVWALAQVYEVPLEELSPIAAEWFATATADANRKPTQRRRNKTWNMSQPDLVSTSAA